MKVLVWCHLKYVNRLHTAHIVFIVILLYNYCDHYCDSYRVSYTGKKPLADRKAFLPNFVNTAWHFCGFETGVNPVT